MTPGSVEPPLLVLGLGNALLGDDGVGIELLGRLVGQVPDLPSVEFLDGGTQGLALLGRLAGRPALLILDAVAAGAEPGTVHVLEGREAVRGPRSTTAHESNARELLEAAELLGEPPGEVFVVGIEPAELRTRIGLSPAVEQALPAALARARELVREITSVAGHRLETGEPERTAEPLAGVDLR